MVTVGQRGPLPHRKRRDSGEQHFTEQANRQKHTRIKLLQNSTIIRVSLVYSHTHTFKIESLLCILNKVRYILTQNTDVLSFLHHSAIWIWWGSAPRAPNVETPLQK